MARDTKSASIGVKTFVVVTTIEALRRIRAITRKSVPTAFRSRIQRAIVGTPVRHLADRLILSR